MTHLEPQPPQPLEPQPLEYQPLEHQTHEVPRTSVLRAVLGPVVFIGFLLLKFGKIAFIAVKGLKFFGTAASMLVSIAAYSFIFGWPFAVGFVLLILVHELGHAIQLKREGIDAGMPVFIPFVGAAIAMKELPRDAAMEARVGIAGPILGSLGALAVHGAAIALDSEMLMALAFTGYFLNLFNLVPLSPLDGGRIAAALSPKLWIGGLVLLLGMFLLSPNPVLLLIVILGGFDSWRRLRDRSPEATAYYEAVHPAFRVGLAIAWIGMVVGLVLLMQVSHVERTF
ncbi:MAG: peptidase [Thermoleophilia bacterium]|nr:peptidase [Thermoleophilia bacterium]MCZ4495512.1 peptidase [Thermoleophilia bacterium]